MKKIALICLLAPLLAFSQADTRPIIQLNGRASAKVLPDVALVNFTVTAMEKAEHETLDKLNVFTKQLTDKLASMGFKPEQLRITNYFIEENIVYSSGKAEKQGYRAHQSLTLKFPFDKDKLTTLFGRFAKEKLENTAMYFSYELSDETQKKTKQQLIREALTDARETASLIAQTSGLRIASVQTIVYGSNPQPIIYGRAEGYAKYEMSQAPSAFSTIGVQEMELSEQVTVTYIVENAR